MIMLELHYPQWQPQVDDRLKSQAKLSESILWESMDYMKFTINSTEYFTIA